MTATSFSRELDRHNKLHKSEPSCWRCLICLSQKAKSQHMNLHFILDRALMVFATSSKASSTCSACRSSLNVLLSSAFLQNKCAVVH